ncbi:Uncharacterised protein [Porphyromonas crevioricanis]|uniref:Uncharacterized protein n=1 Tax=Porphyromonas crevioricanis TaxID=393921 RepID=A0A2X4PNQ7_9PORP|nr:hypothetical protein SAMN02745203_01120 [Porphyromonas crevioricanis]SQH73168.1 Uncharacterised protein [Porphyromonas crevioricanis]
MQEIENENKKYTFRYAKLEYQKQLSKCPCYAAVSSSFSETSIPQLDRRLWDARIYTFPSIRRTATKKRTYTYFNVTRKTVSPADNR